jgi:GAF domain-containing protein
MALLRRRNRNDFDVESCLANLDRLAAVDRSGLIGGPRSARLDDLTRQAAAQLGTPMAALTILDDRRQHIVSGIGLSGDLTAGGSTPVESSYCQYVVAGDAPLAIGDARDDELVREHPATAAGVRSYLGVPVRLDGHTLGSFCVIDVESHDWTSDDLDQLEALADQAVSTFT